MRGKRFVYGSYRGRRSTTDVLKTVALILAVLVVLAVAGVWMAQKYIVYDDGGYHLELPFFQKEGPAQEPEDFRVAVEPAASQPEETPEEGEPLLAAVTVPLSAVEDGSAEPPHAARESARMPAKRTANSFFISFPPVLINLQVLLWLHGRFPNR